MPSIDLNPLPIREQNKLLLAVRDIMHNGGRIPQDVSNELIMAAILELNSSVADNANLSRRNANGLKFLSLGVFLLVVTMVATYNDQFGILSALATFIGA